MAGFFYFIPGQEQIHNPRNETLTEAIGGYAIDHVIGERMKCPDETIAHKCQGPDGIDGTLLYPRPYGVSELPYIGYREDTQQWFKYQNFFIGVVKDELPTPVELEKPEQHYGYKITDGYQREWHAAVFRSPKPDRITLPRIHAFNSQGEYVTKFRDCDEPLWQFAGELRDRMATEEASEAEIVRAAIRFLQLNYFIGVPEVFAFNELGVPLFAHNFVLMIIGTAIDWDKQDELEKKKTETQSAAGYLSA